MTTNTFTTRQQIQQCLQTFDFKRLFIEASGWDNLRETAIPIIIDNQTYILRPLAEKHGVKVYVCDFIPHNILHQADFQGSMELCHSLSFGNVASVFLEKLADLSVDLINILRCTSVFLTTSHTSYLHQSVYVSIATVGNSIDFHPLTRVCTR